MNLNPGQWKLSKTKHKEKKECGWGGENTVSKNSGTISDGQKMHIIGVSEGKRGERKEEKIFTEIMAESFANLMNDNKSQMQEFQRVSSRTNIKHTHTSIRSCTTNPQIESKC